MTKQTKNILLGVGAILAAAYIYKKFVKKEDDFIIEGELDSSKPDSHSDRPVKK